MINKLLSCFFIFILPLQLLVAQSPTFEWANNSGGIYSSTHGFATTIDNEGNFYTTGSFSETADFDPGENIYNLSPYDGPDMFISKLDPNGNFLWAKQIGGYSFEWGSSIVADSSDNIYISGKLSSIVDFDPGEGVFNLDINLGELFILKLSSEGNFIWAKQINAIDESSLVIDKSGNLFLTSAFIDNTDFDPNEGTFYMNSPVEAAFVLKLDPNGNFLWAKQIGGNYDDYYYEWYNYYTIPRDIEIDEFGNIYSIGYLYGAGDFDPGNGTFYLFNSGTYVSKLDSLGNFVWAKSINGYFYSDYYGNDGQSLAIDHQSNLYITGFFEGSTDFDTGDNEAILLSNGGLDMFILKLDPEGNFIFVKQIGGVKHEMGLSIDLDLANNIYTTGIYQSALVDFDPSEGGVFNLITADSIYNDFFIYKLDNSGNFLWAKGFGGVNGYDTGRCISIDKLGNIYTEGSFSTDVDFNPDTGSYVLSPFWFDIFIQKMS